MEGEGEKYWSNQKRRSIGSVSEDEHHTSPYVSDASQDFHIEYEHDKANNNGDEAPKVDSSTAGQPSPFLFLGPVGKKRKIVRERHISEGSNSPVSRFSSPLSPSDPNSPLSNFEQSLKISPVSPLSSEPRPSGRRASASKPATVTSSTYTITEDQPLNLCLATGSVTPSTSAGILTKNPTDFPSTSPNRSVFSHEEHEKVSAPLASPSFSLSGRSDRESGEEPLYGVLSPTPSASLSPSSSIQMYNRRNSNAPNYSTTAGSPSKRKLQCPDCGKEFSQLRNYRYHRSRHEGTSQFACTCPICGKSFNDKGYLSSHLKIHRNAKEYQCEWCEKSFNQRVAYNMHVRIHTGHKPHKCHICPKAFSRKMLLRQHLRTHTGERPYSCEICGKAFADRSNMLLHQRLHSGQRPYKCDICGKSFSKNHHLKTHLNHHAGIKPYQCGKCRATFSQSSNMKTHYRKCSGVVSSSGNLSTNSSAPSSPGSSNPLFTTSIIHPGTTSSGFLPSFSTHLRSHFPTSHLSNLAQQFPSLSAEQATSFSALLHDQLRSSGPSSNILHSPQSSLSSSSVGVSSGPSLSLGLTGLQSPPLIAAPPEKFSSSKMYSRPSSQSQVSGDQTTLLTKAFQKQIHQQQHQIQLHQQHQQPLIHFSALESSPSVLAPSPLSPASSLLLLNPSKSTGHHHQHHHHHQHTILHQSHPHHHSHSHSYSHSSGGSRVIHHTNSASASATSTISDYLETASEPMQIQLHQQQSLQQHHLLQKLHSPTSSSSIAPHSHSYTSHSHGQSSSHIFSPQSQPSMNTLQTNLLQASGHMPISLHHPIPLSPGMSHHHLLEQQIPMHSQGQKIATFTKVPRNVTITTIGSLNRPGSSKPSTTFAEFHSRTPSLPPWEEANEDLKINIKEEPLPTTDDYYN